MYLLVYNELKSNEILFLDIFSTVLENHNGNLELKYIFFGICASLEKYKTE